MKISEELYATEYGMLLHYDNYRDCSTIKSFHDLIAVAINHGMVAYLDLNNIQHDLMQDAKYMKTLKRLQELKLISGDELSYDKDGFHLGEHIFQSLKEVAKALKNKAFL